MRSTFIERIWFKGASFPLLKNGPALRRAAKLKMAELFPLKMYLYCLKIKVTNLEMLSFDQSFLKVNNFSMPGWK